MQSPPWDGGDLRRVVGGPAVLADALYLQTTGVQLSQSACGVPTSPAADESLVQVWGPCEGCGDLQAVPVLRAPGAYLLYRKQSRLAHVHALQLVQFAAELACKDSDPPARCATSTLHSIRAWYGWKHGHRHSGSLSASQADACPSTSSNAVVMLRVGGQMQCMACSGRAASAKSVAGWPCSQLAGATRRQAKRTRC